MLDKKFYIDGVSSAAVGIYLQNTPTFTAAEPKMETVSVPGRNGDLHFYEHAYSNITGKVECYILLKRDLDKALAAVSRWTLAESGYHRLEVTNEPSIYRLAAVSSAPETDIRMRTLAPFTLTFDCKPQRFLRAGERTMHIVDTGASVRNPAMPALPLVTVYGNGVSTLTMGGVTVEFKSGFTGPITLDCDTQNAYYGADNKNDEIYAPTFPLLPSGVSTISWTGGITALDITPRWWSL